MSDTAPAGELRTGFHHKLDQLRQGIARMGATVTERFPGHRHPAAPGPRGRRVHDLGRRRDRRPGTRARGGLLRTARLAVAGRQRPAPDRRRDADRRRHRALRRPGVEHLQGGAGGSTASRARSRSCGGSSRPDGRAGAGACSSEATEAYAEPRRHALAAALHDMDAYGWTSSIAEFIQAIFECHAGGRHRPPGGGAAGSSSARFYERIGDHAAEHGERVRFVVTGWVAEQKGTGAIRRTAGGE